MRVAVVSWTTRLVGGVEGYVGEFLRLLHEEGVDTALFHEVDRPADRPPVPILEGIPRWCVKAMGTEAALEALRGWRPDVLYSQGLADPLLEARVLDIAPAVLFIHNYFGTCISGQKTNALPVVQPCSRRFGPACLFHYFPRRCGGLNPLTMWRLYRRESRRLALLPRYRAIATHSEHMRQEYLNHGVPPERVFQVVYCSKSETEAPAPARGLSLPTLPQAEPPRAEWDLLFVGRMDPLKGGDVLLETAPHVAASLGTRLHLVLAGDGPARGRWQDQARRLQKRHPAIRVEFPGWLSRAQVSAALAAADILVVPSRWPEPFGQVGLEAGWAGIPAAAFNVGGIPAWLRDGVNGFLAPGDPPTARGLAEAVVRCLKDPAVYARLCANARQVAAEFGQRQHLREMMAIFEQAAGARVP
jgi:glycosyltransferase involved in cell wall biosynthesis